MTLNMLMGSKNSPYLLTPTDQISNDYSTHCPRASEILRKMTIYHLARLKLYSLPTKPSVSSIKSPPFNNAHENLIKKLNMPKAIFRKPFFKIKCRFTLFLLAKTKRCENNLMFNRFYQFFV